MGVLIWGGGTGGQLYPAIAGAQALSRKDPNATILFAGRREGMEAKTITSYGLRFAPIPAAPLYTEQLWRNWKLPPVLAAALWQSWRLIDRFKPDVVFGTGGFVGFSLPPPPPPAPPPAAPPGTNPLPRAPTRGPRPLLRTGWTAY